MFNTLGRLAHGVTMERQIPGHEGILSIRGLPVAILPPCRNRLWTGLRDCQLQRGEALGRDGDLVLRRKVIDGPDLAGSDGLLGDITGPQVVVEIDADMGTNFDDTKGIIFVGSFFSRFKR